MQRALLPPRKPQHAGFEVCSQPSSQCQTCWPCEFCSIFSKIMCLLGFSGKEGNRYFTAQISKGSGIRSVYCTFCSHMCLLISNNVVKTQKCLKFCYILVCSFVPLPAVCVQSNGACSKWFLVRQSRTIHLNHNVDLVWVLSWCVPVCGIWEISSLFFIRQSHRK